MEHAGLNSIKPLNTSMNPNCSSRLISYRAVNTFRPSYKNQPITYVWGNNSSSFRDPYKTQNVEVRAVKPGGT
jgi:hypothetical protein